MYAAAGVAVVEWKTRSNSPREKQTPTFVGVFFGILIRNSWCRSWELWLPDRFACRLHKRCASSPSARP